MRQEQEAVKPLGNDEKRWPVGKNKQDVNQGATRARIWCWRGGGGGKGYRDKEGENWRDAPAQTVDVKENSESTVSICKWRPFLPPWISLWFDVLKISPDGFTVSSEPILSHTEKRPASRRDSKLFHSDSFLHSEASTMTTVHFMPIVLRLSPFLLTPPSVSLLHDKGRLQHVSD